MWNIRAIQGYNENRKSPCSQRVSYGTTQCGTLGQSKGTMRIGRVLVTRGSPMAHYECHWEVEQYGKIGGSGAINMNYRVCQHYRC